ncbi:TetR/AcrR family transcriptional regulator [Phytoactinopolyspora mesophila]|uniref:TetR family transcriptional regulator n=1 Tax=Phytoactinopolyspora mesophila TaxID=2650750 RepID=A0A7K3M8M1_9ACTN|nr:TetR/AcrR family transcriptional regulator [Phytoactinopolyspora mesophila]NDL59619.1 TetR family transcriptional regulator [Phytoactinopolyspora mesophila]
MNATVGALQHRLRADASRNRERIMAAARHVLLEAGPDAPLDTIAQRAGVGNATVYRHFADRRELFRQVVLYSMERITDAAEAALADPADPFDVLSGFIHTAADEHVGSVCSLTSEDFDRNAPPVVAARERLLQAIEALMSRARDAGQLRPDVTIGDLMVAITQLSRPMPGSECTHFERFARRHLQLFIDGLRSPARSTLPGESVTLEDLERRST